MTCTLATNIHDYINYKVNLNGKCSDLIFYTIIFPPEVLKSQILNGR